jgi:hypothetical protein
LAYVGPLDEWLFIGPNGTTVDGDVPPRSGLLHGRHLLGPHREFRLEVIRQPTEPARRHLLEAQQSGLKRIWDFIIRFLAFSGTRAHFGLSVRGSGLPDLDAAVRIKVRPGFSP